MIFTRKKNVKRGGTLKKERIMPSLLDGEHLDKYYTYLEILSAIMKQGYSVNIKNKTNGSRTEICVKGETAERLMDYGGRGKDTLLLNFKCNQNINLSIKAYVNMEFTRSKSTYDEYRVAMSKMDIWGPIREFVSINKFDSPYIIKAYKYFFFNGKSCEFSSIVSPKISTDIEIVDIIGKEHPKITEEDATKRGWKMTHIPSGKEEIPWFSGIVLSRAQYNINKDLSKHYGKIDDIFILYKQYILGIKEISKRGYIHRNLHWANLMYNYNEKTKQITGQIIHIHKIYDIEDATKIVKFKGAREAITPKKDVAFLEKVTANMTQTPDEEKGKLFLNKYEKQIMCIKNNYDLYSLSKSFIHILENLENKITIMSEIIRLKKFKQILDSATNEDFLLRINNDIALQQLNEIYSY
jgi:hypothetical protein